MTVDERIISLSSSLQKLMFNAKQQQIKGKKKREPNLA